MLRSSFLVFIAGWLTWFWIDNPAIRRSRLPPVSDSMLENFRMAFDLMKAGHVELSYIFLWKAHYLVLSLLFGALLAVGYRGLADHLGRRRMRRHFTPPARRDPEPPPAAGSGESGPAQSPDRPRD